MTGFLFPGRNPLLTGNDAFFVCQSQQWSLVSNNYRKVEEIQEDVVEFDHFYYYNGLVQCKHQWNDCLLPTMSPNIKLSIWRFLTKMPYKNSVYQKSCILEERICMKNYAHAVSIIKKEEAVFCVCNTSPNLLSVRLSIIGCQSFYFLSILSRHKVPWCCTIQVFTNLRSVTYHLYAYTVRQLI